MFVAFKDLTLLTWKSSLSKGSHIAIFNQSVRSTKFCHATWRSKAVKWLKRLPSSRLSKRSQRNLRKYRVVKFRFFFSQPQRNLRKYRVVKFRFFFLPTDENISVIFVSTVLLLIHMICSLTYLIFFSFLEGLAFKLVFFFLVSSQLRFWKMNLYGFRLMTDWIDFWHAIL